jgi:hypothetical protein
LTTKEQIFQEAFNLPWIMLPEDLAHRCPNIDDALPRGATPNVRPDGKTLSTFSFSQLRVDGQAIQEKISPKAASARALDLLSGWTAAKKEKEDHTAAVQQTVLR